MNAAARIAKLERALRDVADSGYMDPGAWLRPLESVGVLIPAGTASAAVGAFLTHWYAFGYPAMTDDVRRVPSALAAFIRVCPVATREGALAGGLADNSSAMYRWVISVSRLRSRIPPNLDSEVVGELLTRFAAPHDSAHPLSDMAIVCDGCGLRRPYEMPSVDRPGLGACPGCNDGDWTWENRIDESRPEWRAAAERELRA